MFELIQRENGRSKRTLYKSDNLEEIARVSAEKSGEDFESIFEFFSDDRGRDE